MTKRDKRRRRKRDREQAKAHDLRAAQVAANDPDPETYCQSCGQPTSARVDGVCMGCYDDDVASDPYHSAPFVRPDSEPDDIPF